MGTPSSGSTVDAVGLMYDLFPYPHYPLWIPLRWVDGVQGSAAFASSLVEHQSSFATATQPRVLIAGCGETQPWILRKVEARQVQMDAVDISRRNLQRAHRRTLFCSRSIQYFHRDLMRHCKKSAEKYDHIDCYGVLHHLQEPTLGFASLFRALKPGGTMRMMVYNAWARQWIQHLQKVMQQLKLHYSDEQAIEDARIILRKAALHSVRFKRRFEEMGPSIWRNKSRFVDCFLHARETQVSLSEWWETLSQSNIHLIGLWDRYAELDDLPNPLRYPPTVQDLENRIVDGRFENNFEVYLQKPFEESSRHNRIQKASLKHLYLCRAPSSWFQYRETRNLAWRTQLKLWHLFIQRLEGSERPIDNLIEDLSESCLRRLARLGVIRSSQLSHAHLQNVIHEPIYASMDNPDSPPRQTQLRYQMEDFLKYLGQKRRCHPRQVELALEHLVKAEACSYANHD